MPPTLSIITATFNRADLLDRALATYAQQTLVATEWELLVADDGSTDHTREVVGKWQGRGLPVRYFEAGADLGRKKAPGVWRDGSGVRNALSTHANGQYLISTHPEILLPPITLEAMYMSLSTAPPHLRPWVTAIPYWLPPVPEMYWQNWQGSKAELDALRRIPGFYAADWPGPVEAPGSIDYRNQSQESRMSWESEVFWGMRMADWRWLGGFREFEKWGSVDMDFWGRRRTTGFTTLFASHPKSTHAQQVLMVYHPHHDSPRVMEDAMAELQTVEVYRDVEHVRQSGGLASTYHHGPRERAALPGTVEGVMQDHINRYQWAAVDAQRLLEGTPLTGPPRVLDAPCGTGYGCRVFRDALPGFAVNYTLCDIDFESLETAALYLQREDLALHADMQALPTPDALFDVIVSFEGLEHVPDPARMLSEFARVLKPGGLLYLSTPRKGNTPGTAWDRFMLTPDSLRWLFSNGPWRDLTPFHQVRYGNSFVEPGQGPADAEVQIVRVRRL